MVRNTPVIAGLAVLAIAVILLFAWTSSINTNTGDLTADVSQMRDSLAFMQRVVDSLKAQRPGLGEYMSTIQLHAAKLWFAAQASNWGLSKYELDELEETLEAAEQLHAVKNNVDISGVLQSVRRTQLSLIGQSLAKRDPLAFGRAYGQAIAACNGCHQVSGYEFIRIIRPTREPVTNQRWNARRN